MTNVEKIFKSYFGYDKFLPGQKEAIESIVSGRDTLVIFPTGGGKSLCYQIPALIFKGITLVISPLISLMKDQVDELLGVGISSTYISSTISDREIDLRIQNMKKKTYKIVYIAPERFYSDVFIEALSHVEISFVAIDEAHCVSQWGHNFRPAYLKIKDFIDKIGNPVSAAFTATADTRVQEDIINLLGLIDCDKYINSFDRPNLSFIVEKHKNKMRYILKHVREHRASSGIIYAGTRKNVEKLFLFLKDRDISVGMYHAGLNSISRNKTQEDFINGNTKVIIATNAFGMGINKADVRYVIHYNMPKTVEDYYQEAGRAGRDGKRARCILLYSNEDMTLNRYIINTNYPPVKLVETIYKRVERRGKRGIYYDLLLNSYSRSKYAVESAIKKLIEHGYVKSDNGYLYAILNGAFDLTQESIDIHKDVELNKLIQIQGYCDSNKCLRKYILNYFNEDTQVEKCYNCSACGFKITGKESKKLETLLDDLFSAAKGK
ncbi:MAG: ATP-dependent DNA helicase RecQ [Clostridiales bacterium]|nr:ATP-dependent DNA helicase RecQ [Clostridiales bacterium]